VRLEGLGELKNLVASSGIEARHLQACSIVGSTNYATAYHGRRVVTKLKYNENEVKKE
jgi:hypothetical protein